MSKLILHVDMDAFYAAVECRDKPALVGKPLIIGALPSEPRGVVSTCSYEARAYGVHSAMPISQAYRLCPHAIFMHPDMAKYKQASDALHDIWCSYTDVVEFLSLDEGYLDVTGTVQHFGTAMEIAQQIKARSRAEVGLSCSVGIGYSMASAKLASEEKKPDGLFAIPDAAFFKKLVAQRDVQVLYGVGARSAAALKAMGIYKVQDIWGRQEEVAARFGKRGQQLAQLANGIDTRRVTPYYESEAKSIGKEETFPQDITDRAYIQNYLRLWAKDLSRVLYEEGVYAQTLTLKITFGNMKAITRSKSGAPTNRAHVIYETAVALLADVEHAPIRLAGLSVSKLVKEVYEQLSFLDTQEQETQRKDALEQELQMLQDRFGQGMIKTASELEAEHNIKKGAEGS